MDSDVNTPDLSTMDTDELVEYLIDHPDCADQCDEWENIDGKWWSMLLIAQPQFSDKCDWTKLEEADWDELLKYQPQFTTKRQKRKSDERRQRNH